MEITKLSGMVRKTGSGLKCHGYNKFFVDNQSANLGVDGSDELSDEFIDAKKKVRN